MDQSSVLDVLVQKSLISAEDVSSARTLQAGVGGEILDALVRLGAIDEDTLISEISSFWDIPTISSEHLPKEVDPVLQALEDLDLGHEWIERNRAIVWWQSDEMSTDRWLIVAARNPLNPQLRETIERGAHLLAMSSDANPFSIHSYLMSRSQFEGLKSFLPSPNADYDDIGDDTELSRLRELAEEAPIIDLVNQVFAEAIKRRASDIHFEPYDKLFDIRFRIDGVIQTWQSHSRSRYDAVSTRIKLISGMDIAERRLPQDGRQSIRVSGQLFDLRVSSLPGAWGESLVLRLLDRSRSLPSLDELGLTGRMQDQFGNLIANPDGIILVTGPTGSGKSTTLYRALEEVNDGKKKIITIEDPIEYEMPQVVQTQVKADIGFTFAGGLRSILRQDPDVIMIGEIRDSETAAIAVQASLTGHLVLSTLHTNTALLAVARLRDLGLEPFLIGSAVKAFAAQRLVRRICSHCKTSAPRPDNLALLEVSRSKDAIASIDTDDLEENWSIGTGCDMCSGTGFLGRVALFELVPVDAELRQLILNDANAAALEAEARRQGFRSLVEDGYQKARSGITTVSEVIRVTANNAVDSIAQ